VERPQGADASIGQTLHRDMVMGSVDTERDKYRRVWALDTYRTHSPGQDAVRSFLSGCGWHQGDTIACLGCGTGREAVGLSNAGLKPTLFDLIPEAVEVQGFPFHEVNLWDLPEGIPVFDWLYSVDVLEHIPPEHIPSTLEGFARITGKGGYIQVACAPDGWGKRIGEELHLTVRPPKWWLKQLSEWWPTEYNGNIVLRNLPRDSFTIGEPHAKRNGPL